MTRQIGLSVVILPIVGIDLTQYDIQQNQIYYKQNNTGYSPKAQWISLQ